MTHPRPLFAIALVAGLLATPTAARAADTSGTPGTPASKPVKVFILCGQSNMEGKAAAYTLDAVINDPATHDRFKHLKNGDAWAQRDDVFVTYLDREESPVSPTRGRLTVGFGSPKNARDDSGKRINVPGVGPELGIGWVLGDHFDQPVLLIKAAWGGRAIHHTFRPPSAMPTDAELAERLEQIRPKNPMMTLEDLRASYGSDYRKVLSETRRVLDKIDRYVPGYDKAAGYELAGFIWFQGWNDAVGEGNPKYTEQLACFIRDIRKDLGAPNLPFVIGELGTDGEEATGWVVEFRKRQQAVAEMPEFAGNVAFTHTAQFWPHPPDTSKEWAEFRAAAQANEKKPETDPNRVDPGQFYQENWVQKHKDRLAYTSDKRYHYLGSGRAYYEMGQAMARDMINLLGKPE